MKAILRFLLRWLFQFEAHGESVVKAKGPVLLVPNHVSWIDWLFVWVCLDEDWRFVTSSATAQSTWLHRKIMLNRQTFPIDASSPYAVKRMAEFLQGSGRLVLFAEGRISLTGTLMKLFEGTGFLLFKSEARVITCYLRGVDRLFLVKHKGRREWFPAVQAHFSELLKPPVLQNISTTLARQKLTNWLLDRMVDQQFETDLAFGRQNPLEAVLETARRCPRAVALEDVSRQELTFRRLVVGVRLLSRRWSAGDSSDGSSRLGVLLPNANSNPVVILSLWAAGKVPAILNFSSGTATMLACARLAGLKRIITSRLFEEKAKLKLEPFREAGIQITYLEDLRAGITGSERFLALVQQTLFPSAGFEFAKPDAPAVILFTSGSEGTPKGVELSHRNLMANIRQMLAVIDLEDSDRMFNALPMFHSFGLTVGTLLPLVRGIYCFLYPSPLHYRVVPSALYDRACTVMLGTNTFLNGYARKAHPYDFRTVRLLFAGAEKLQSATAETWARRFGVRILEGFGATECGPAISVNTSMRPWFGSAGRLLPGMQFKLEPVEGVSTGGRLFVRGPNIMLGYLNPEANAVFQALGGWYDTGDIVTIDSDGFVFILGRLKRFAKVSGEMVSLTAVEEALAGAFPEYGMRCEVAILSRPDEEKGEVLIAVTNEPKIQLEMLRSVIRAKGLTNLCVPREIKSIREIPKLGTGKVDHRRLRELINPSKSAAPLA